ncbi:MAG TPA: hypothetical protein VHA09_07435 [Nitrososphaera sp.]|nr:hypothetical protein [Nitrososphaera sp.]
MVVMVGETIANYGPYVGVAIGLFVVGLFAIMVYEKSSGGRSKQQQQQQQRPAADATDGDKRRAS